MLRRLGVTVGMAGAAAIALAALPSTAFAWGGDAEKAVYNGAVLEEIARMAFITRSINSDAPRLPRSLVHKHFERKHGKDAYYGQNRIGDIDQ